MMAAVSFSIDGMSCGHCVAAVKEALEGVTGVAVKNVSIGSATVEFDGDAATADAITLAIKLAVEDAGYFAEVAPG